MYIYNSIRIVLSLFILFILPINRCQAAEPIWEERLVNHATTTIQPKGAASVYVVHYFAPITENGFSDMFGIYGTANIQMGAEFGLGGNTSVWYTTEKINKTQEIGVRYKLTEEEEDENENPVGIAAAFSVSVDGRDKRYFGENYYFVDRFFYTGQIAVSKQISHRWEMLLNGTYAHLNIVPEGEYSTFLALNPSLSFKLNRKKALFASFDFPLGIASASDVTAGKPKPLMTIGAILKSRTHNFQLFVSNGNQINSAKSYLNDRDGFNLDALCFGFNIHVKLGHR